MGTVGLLSEIRDHVYRHGLDATVARYAALSQWPGEVAGIWLRVSTGQQDEASQLPEVLRHCAQRGYRPAEWYVVHDKSASRGEQQSQLDEMLTDLRDTKTGVCVCWHSDRLERRGPEYLFRTLRQAKDAGGLIGGASRWPAGTWLDGSGFAH